MCSWRRWGSYVLVPLIFLFLNYIVWEKDIFWSPFNAPQWWLSSSSINRLAQKEWWPSTEGHGKSADFPLVRAFVHRPFLPWRSVRAGGLQIAPWNASQHVANMVKHGLVVGGCDGDAADDGLGLLFSVAFGWLLSRGFGTWLIKDACCTLLPAFRPPETCQGNLSLQWCLGNKQFPSVVS